MALLRSFAGQIFLLQVLIIALLVVGVVTTLVLESRGERFQAARDRSLATAEGFAHGAGLPQALRGPDPSSTLQPLTEAARKAADVDFVIVMNRDGIRYTSPQVDWIGGKFVGTIGPSLAGHVTVETVQGPDGERVQAVVPVWDGDKVVGMVSSGLGVDEVTSDTQRELPFVAGVAVGGLVLATAGTGLVSRRLRRQTHGLGPAEMTRMYEHHDAVLHAVREGVVIVNDEGNVVLANDEARRLLGLSPDVEGRPVSGLALDPRMADLLVSRRVVTDEVLPVGDRLLAVNNRPTESHGRPAGSVATLRDTTELREISGKAEAAQGRLQLLYEASVAIGTTLDVTRTSEELTEVASRRFADYVTVDLAEPVLRGDEPSPGSYTQAPELHRVAFSGRYSHPLYQVGETYTYPPSTPMAEALGRRQAVLVPDVAAAAQWRAGDSERTQLVLGYGLHSLITAPLMARGVLMGVANFWRMSESPPLAEDDLAIAEELAARAAVCVDNARRYTREHTMAVALQRSLLPSKIPEQSALEVASRYLPAPTGVRGDWFDVIPLPGSRVALVVGDVAGHGLHAAATMGRLRTAVLNFSALDLPPDELLGHLDELVTLIDHDMGSADEQPTIIGATCLYAIYDPTTGTCTLARAGHPLPALVRPDGTVEFPELPAGLPLGVGGLPFEAVELNLPEGSSLAFYTDGLIANHEHDVNSGLATLHAALATSGRPPEETCEAVLQALLPARQNDDIALLVARTRRMAPDRIAQWEVPCEPSAVADARADITRQLTRWGLEELVFTTELALSELITNAIRYAPGPIQVRLLYDRSLICEVYDTGSTSPHLRYAADEDEGGRGLFLIAQLTERWGTRYFARGKVIWAEQALPGPVG